MRNINFVLVVVFLIEVGCEGYSGGVKKVGNIEKDSLSPFLTIERMTDTIRLGEVYSSNINLKNPLKGYVYNIYKSEQSENVMRVQYEKLAMNSLQATYTFTPMNIGEYIYLISVVEKKNSNDSLQHVKTYDYKGRYWVVP